jgi:hypothetical protein
MLLASSTWCGGGAAHLGHGCGGLLFSRSWSAGRIKVVVLGLLLHQEEDLLVACSYWSSQSVEFRKASWVNSLRYIMSGVCSIRCNMVLRTPVFSGCLFSELAWRSSVVFCHHVTRLTVHGEVRSEEWYESLVFEDLQWWFESLWRGVTCLVSRDL